MALTSPATLWHAVGERITPLIDMLRQHLLSAPLIHMDEVNQEEGRATHAASYSAAAAFVLFDYAASRAGRAPVGQLGDYAGRLLTDATLRSSVA